jgi:hypothetical protein
MRERDLFDRLNPFARSHHTESISVHSPEGAERFPPSNERFDFKRRVAAFYGLQAADAESLVDMFGVTRPIGEVTLAHVWPASYTNWGDVEDELAMPVGFHSEPRNFMLLPRDVHAAFDDGRVMFVPSLSSIKCFVLSPAGVSDAVRQLHGRDLHLPLLTSPYKRMLAFFARCATRQSFTSLDGDVQAALESAMASSEDSAGNEALQSLIDRMVDVGLVSGGRGE